MLVVKQPNLIFWCFIGSLIGLGATLGYLLSCLHRLLAYKVVNVWGLVLAFLGVLVLSEIFASEWWKSFCVKRLAPAILWTHSVVPLGALVGGLAAQIMKKPSASIVILLSTHFWSYSLLGLGAFNEVVVFPQLSFFKKDVETRWRWMGLFLVLGGVLAQLVAAIIDLIT